MYGSGRCSVISFIFHLSVVTNYAEVTHILYVLMLRNKYDSNMDIQAFISLSIILFGILCAFMQKVALQNLYVSLVRLKPYNADYAFCNRAATIGLKLDG